MSRKDFNKAFGSTRERVGQEVGFTQAEIDAMRSTRERVGQEQAHVQRWISVGFAVGGGMLIALSYGIGCVLGWW